MYYATFSIHCDPDIQTLCPSLTMSKLKSINVVSPEAAELVHRVPLTTLKHQKPCFCLPHCPISWLSSCFCPLWLFLYSWKRKRQWTVGKLSVLFFSQSTRSKPERSVILKMANFRLLGFDVHWCQFFFPLPDIIRVKVSDVVATACNPSTQEVQGDGLKYKASLGYWPRLLRPDKWRKKDWSVVCWECVLCYVCATHPSVLL